jgi:hypothetical protein
MNFRLYLFIEKKNVTQKIVNVSKKDLILKHKPCKQCAKKHRNVIQIIIDHCHRLYSRY